MFFSSPFLNLKKFRGRKKDFLKKKPPIFLLLPNPFLFTFCYPYGLGAGPAPGLGAGPGDGDGVGDGVGPGVTAPS